MVPQSRKGLYWSFLLFTVLGNVRRVILSIDSLRILMEVGDNNNSAPCSRGFQLPTTEGENTDVVVPPPRSGGEERDEVQEAIDAYRRKIELIETTTQTTRHCTSSLEKT
jgi:hypothetical protein